MMGYQHHPSRPHRNWVLLYRPDGSPSRIFFDLSPKGVHKLAFESPEPVSDGQFRVVPVPLSPHPESLSID
jgi:hypothetical protein